MHCQPLPRDRPHLVPADRPAPFLDEAGLDGVELAHLADGLPARRDAAEPGRGGIDHPVADPVHRERGEAGAAPMIPALQRLQQPEEALLEQLLRAVAGADRLPVGDELDELDVGEQDIDIATKLMQVKQAGAILEIVAIPVDEYGKTMQTNG